MSPLRICCDTLCSLIEQVETMWKSAIFDRASGHLHSGSGPAMRRLPGRSGVHLHQWLIKEIQHTLVGCLGIKSDSETSPDCATRIAQLCLRNYCRQIPQLPGLCNSLVGLRNYLRQIAQLPGLRNSWVGLRNYLRQIAQLPGLRNSWVGLRNNLRQIVQLPGLRNSLVGLRNYCRQIAQLPGLRNSLVGLRNYCRQIAQLPGLRNSLVGLRNSQDCATLRSNCVTTDLQSPQD